MKPVPISETDWLHKQDKIPPTWRQQESWCRIPNDAFAPLSAFRYFSLPPEEREKSGIVNPMCELFPKQVACYYSRYGMGGGLDSRHAMCILGQNMMNDKVFLLIWVWQGLLVLIGINRAMTRSFQLTSARVRFFLMKVKMDRYFRNNAHIKHI